MARSPFCLVPALLCLGLVTAAEARQPGDENDLTGATRARLATDPMFREPPPALSRASWGRVKAEVLRFRASVDAQGRIVELHSLRDEVPRSLMLATRRAVKQWQFAPAVDAQGQPTAMQVQLALQLVQAGPGRWQITDESITALQGPG